MPDIIHEIELPSGVQFRGPTFPEVWAEYVEHSSASVAEGMCPRHRIPLGPYPAKPGFVSGKCGDCETYYALEVATGDFHGHFYRAGPPWWAA